jgi:hypothetical protein
MKNFILAAAVVVALGTAGTVQAKGKHVSHHSHHSSHHAKHHVAHHVAKAHVAAKAGVKVHAAARAAVKVNAVAKPAVKVNATAKAAVKVNAVAKAGVTVRTGARVAAGAAVVKAGGATYYRTHGVRYAGGYYFAGRNHHHWSESQFSSTYNTTVYKDPGLNVWYCWNEKDGGYYPVGGGK